MSLSLSCCLMFIGTGCGGGSGGPKLYKVTGSVSYNGEPIKEGRIVFRKSGSPSGQSYSAPIADGNYSLESEAGAMVVEITGSRIIPGKFDKSNGTPEPLGEMYIPAKYNSATKLTATVESKTNTIPFQLDK
jgi:hypothetical protein